MTCPTHKLNFSPEHYARTFTQREAPFPKSVPQRLVEEAEGWRQMPLEALREKLKAERRRALAGHWTYDLTRHRLMLEVFRIREIANERARAA